jgi:uncharacterized protein (DUF433 family)
MAATAYRYLINLPGVCRGKTIIEGTRIGVHIVIGLLQNGETVDSVCSKSCFPDITKAQVYECLAYYEDHRTEIEALVIEQMTEPEP